MLVARTKMESTCCTLLWLVAMEKCGFPLGLGLGARRAGKLRRDTLALTCSKCPKGPKPHGQDETQDPGVMADIRAASPKSGV